MATAAVEVAEEEDQPARQSATIAGSLAIAKRIAEANMFRGMPPQLDLDRRKRSIGDHYNWIVGKHLASYTSGHGCDANKKPLTAEDQLGLVKAKIEELEKVSNRTLAEPPTASGGKLTPPETPWEGMRLSRMGRTPGIERWMRFDLEVSGQSLEAFADSGATHCFIAKRIVNLLGLELQQSSGRVRLEGGKTVDILGATELQWSYGTFSTTTSCKVLDMDHDLILGEDFWKEYRLVPDYDTLGVQIQKDGVSHRLHGATNTCRLQVLENTPTEYKEINLRGFE